MTTTRIADSAFAANIPLKESVTQPGKVTPWLSSESPSLYIGYSLDVSTGDGSTIPVGLPIGDLGVVLYGTTTPLGANEVYTMEGVSTQSYGSLQIQVFSDAASLASTGLQIQFSTDNVNWDTTQSFDVDANRSRALSLTCRGAFFRIIYTNGSFPQTLFRLLTFLQPAGAGLTTKILSDDVDEDNLAIMSRAFLSAVDVTGSFRNVLLGPDNSSNVAYKLAVTGGVATAAPPTRTEGMMVPWSVDLAGYTRVVLPSPTIATRAITRSAVPLVTLNSSAIFPLLAFRRNASFPTTILKPVGVGVVCTSNSVFNWYLLINPTVVGAALVFAAEANTACDTSKGALSATTLTGGIIIAAGVSMQTNEGGTTQIPDPGSALGTSDICVLAVQRVTGTVETFYGSLTWSQQD